MSQQSDRVGAPPLTAAESEAMARAMQGAGHGTSGRQRREGRESMTEQQARRARLTSGEARRTAAFADAARTGHQARNKQPGLTALHPRSAAERRAHHTAGEAARIENMTPDERTAHQAHHAAGEANRVEHMAPDSVRAPPVESRVTLS